MKIKFPVNCLSEASRWSFCVKLNEVLRLDHNASGQSFRDKRLELHTYLAANETYIKEDVALAATPLEWDCLLPNFKEEIPANILSIINELNSEMDLLLKNLRNFQKEFKVRSKASMLARNEQIEISRMGAHWNPKIPDHVSNGVIAYPTGLNQGNEGSRASFLFGLEKKLKDAGKEMIDPDMVVVHSALSQAKTDAVNNVYWDPQIGDIVSD